MLDAVADSDDCVRQVLVDWMAASWVRHFAPEEALNLAHEVTEQHAEVFGDPYGSELITRTLWRMSNLYDTKDPKGAAEVLMDMQLNVDPRYVASLRQLNEHLTDGEG